MNCKICGEFKVRLANGKYPGSRNKRYVDENGKLWNGTRCPLCTINAAKEAMRKSRFKRSLSE